MLKLAHDQGRDAEKEQSDCFRPAHHKRRDGNVALVPVLLLKSLKPACSDQNEASEENGTQSEEHEHPPARPQTVGSHKNLFQRERAMKSWLERFGR